MSCPSSLSHELVQLPCRSFDRCCTSILDSQLLLLLSRHYHGDASVRSQLPAIAGSAPHTHKHTRCANEAGRRRSPPPQLSCWAWHPHLPLTRHLQTTPSPSRPSRSSPSMAIGLMVAPHASTATSRTSSASSLPTVARPTDDATAVLDLAARTVQSHSVALCLMARTVRPEEAQRNANAQKVGLASTATSAKPTMLVTP